MVFRKGRFGEFLGCSGYPECKNTKPLGAKETGNEKTSDQKCEKCGEFLVIKRNRYGKPFLACPRYPKCTFAASLKKAEGT
jgi:DNA topoisomerase-1